MFIQKYYVIAGRSRNVEKWTTLLLRKCMWILVNLFMCGKKIFQKCFECDFCDRPSKKLALLDIALQLMPIMGAGRTGQGGALVPPWNFKIIIIIVYKCNMYYLWRLKRPKPPTKINQKKINIFFVRNFSKFTIFFTIFKIYIRDPESAE